MSDIEETPCSNNYCKSNTAVKTINKKMKEQDNVSVVKTSHVSFNGANVRTEIIQLPHDKELFSSNCFWV